MDFKFNWKVPIIPELSHRYSKSPFRLVLGLMPALGLGFGLSGVLPGSGWRSHGSWKSTSGPFLAKHRLPSSTCGCPPASSCRLVVHTYPLSFPKQPAATPTRSSTRSRKSPSTSMFPLPTTTIVPAFVSRFTSFTINRFCFIDFPHRGFPSLAVGTPSTCL